MWESGVALLPPTVARGGTASTIRSSWLGCCAWLDALAAWSPPFLPIPAVSLTSQFLCFFSSSLVLLNWVAWPLQSRSVSVWLSSLRTLSLPLSHLKKMQSTLSLP